MGCETNCEVAGLRNLGFNCAAGEGVALRQPSFPVAAQRAAPARSEAQFSITFKGIPILRFT
jgi:hypothetical protein